MADYYPLIARAVAGLPQNTDEARRVLYDRVHNALAAQFRGQAPTLSESEFMRERRALDDAIRKVEMEVSGRLQSDQAHSAPAAIMNQDSDFTKHNAIPQARSSSGPNIVQAFVWGAAAAMWGAVFAGIGGFLSDKAAAPTLPDSLHGRSNLVELRKYIDEVLSNASAVLQHDGRVVGLIGIGVVVLSLFSVAVTAFFLIRTRRLPIPYLSLRLTGFAVCALDLAPLIFAVMMPELQPLQGASILEAIGNQNTRPSIVIAGESIRVKLPTRLQSFQGNYRSASFSIRKSEANLLDGTTMSVQLMGVAIQNIGEKRGKTDLIPLMQNVDVWLTGTLPIDPKLTGALVRIDVAGTLALISSSQYEFSGSYPYETAISFRIAGEDEHQFYSTYTPLSDRILNYRLASFGVSAVLILLMFAFRAKILFAPFPPRPTEGNDKALVWAARYGYRDVVRELLDKRTDPNARDADGMTALIWASSRGYFESVQALLAKRADVNAQDAKGMTALMLASKAGHGRGAGATRKVVRALLDKGADPNAEDGDGMTALMWTYNDRKVVDALLDEGADVNARDAKGLTPLMWASLNGSSEVAQALIDKGADVNAKANAGSTALTMAKDAVVRALLVKAGAK